MLCVFSCFGGVGGLMCAEGRGFFSLVLLLVFWGRRIFFACVFTCFLGSADFLHGFLCILCSRRVGGFFCTSFYVFLGVGGFVCLRLLHLFSFSEGLGGFFSIIFTCLGGSADLFARVFAYIFLCACRLRVALSWCGHGLVVIGFCGHWAVWS